MFDEFRREFAVDEKLEMVVPGNHVGLIPIPFVDFLERDGSLNPGHCWIVVGIDDQTVTPKAGMFTSTGCVKIPRPQHLLANSHVTQIRVVSLKIASSRCVLTSTNVDTTIALSWQPVAEL